MSFDREAVPAELADDFDEAVEAPPFAEFEGESGIRIAVLVDDVSDGKPVATACGVDLAGGIFCAEKLSHLHGAMLPPGLVEGNPLHDGGMKAEQIHHRLEFAPILVMCFIGPGRIGRVGLEPCLGGTAALAFPLFPCA